MRTLARALLAAVATGAPGAPGGVVSGVGVVTDATGEYGPRFPAASPARTRYR